MRTKIIISKRMFCFFLILFYSLIMINSVFAQTRNLSVEIFGPDRYSDIWLGISTGGYDIIAERGKDLSLRVFVKNGMPDRSLNNLEIIPNNFPFEINNIKPKKIEQLKPMEIVIFWVNISIPEDAQVGRYVYVFNVKSDEFPTGVFSLNDEIKVVKRIKTELYALYAVLSIIILVMLFYRKWTIAKQGKKR